MNGKTVRILGVHGVKNYQAGLEPAQAAGRMAAWWGTAIRKGLGMHDAPSGLISVDIGYYAHRLHLGTSQGDEDPGSLDPEIQHLIVDWARLCGEPIQTPQGALTAPSRAAVEWVANKFGLDHKPARILATVFFREVQTYFTDADRRKAATTDVANAVERAEPNVVIAHSLGSVVAYEALWANPHPPIDLFLTVGSPLAMPDIVYHRLQAHEGLRGRPPAVAKWINIADPGDVIAVPIGGITTNFQQVTADLTDAIGAFSFHQVTKYLRCGVTAGILAAYLRPA